MLTYTGKSALNIRPAANRLVRFLPALAVFLCFALLAGCGESKQEEESGGQAKQSPHSAEQTLTGQPLVGVLLYRASDPYIASVARAIENELAGKVRFEIVSADNDQLTQNEQLKDFLAKKAAALAVNIVDHQAGPLFADRAGKGSVPLVFFNREPDLTAMKGYKDICFVGTRHLEAGIIQGEIISNIWQKHPEYDRNRDGKFQYLMLQANPDHPEAIARTEYSVRTARELGVPMEQVGDTLLCDWDYQQAQRAVGLALDAYPDQVELIVANNDAMALGALAALEAKGFNLAEKGGKSESAKYIPIVGVDALPEALEAIRQGKMSGTVKQDGELMGRTIAAFLLNAVHGKDFLDGTGLEWDESGQAVRLPYTRIE